MRERSNICQTKIFRLLQINNTFEKITWLRAVQFNCNISAKSVTPVQKV